MSILKVDPDNFTEVVLTSEKPVLLDFWATWCGPCQMIAPVIEEIAAENPQYLIGKVNVDEQPALAQAFGIVSIPTLVVIKDGKAVDQMVGVHSKAQILALLEQ
ncbi:MAG: thioredoxin [Clostridia bacterium]|nr:thioredoxin [Clostridia bacterium]